MELKDLKQSISSLSEEELISLIQGYRAARRTYGRKVKKQEKQLSLLDGLTPEQMEELLAQLEGTDG
jgi:hypothetical protein